MRYDKKILIYPLGESHYDPKLGRNVSTNSTPITKYAHISDIGDTETKLGLVDLKLGGIYFKYKVVRLKNALNVKIDYILYDNKKYKSEKVKQYRDDTTIFMHEY